MKRRARALPRRYGRMASGSIYDRLKEAGLELDHHESDLYVRATPEAYKLTAGQPNRSTFRDSKGALWIELPFAYQPFWEGKKRR